MQVAPAAGPRPVHGRPDRRRDSAPRPSPRLGSPAVPAIRRRTFGRGRRRRYALDAASGRTQWVHDVGDKVRGEPAVANGRVYVSTINDDDFLHAIGTTQPAAAPVRKGGGKKSGSDKGDSGDVVPIVFAALGFLVLVLAGASVAVPAMRNRAAATRWARMMNSDDDAAPDGSSAGPFVELQDAAMREVI